MTTAVAYPGIPGLAVRIGRSLERWGERAARPVDYEDRAYRAWRRNEFLAARAEQVAVARSNMPRVF
jgi:hypothetical protein